MKYSLRSLMIVLAIAPPLLALGWFGWESLKPVERPEEMITFPIYVPHSWEKDEPPTDWTEAASGYTGTLGSVPDSSAPAPNSPKNQSGPDNDP